MAKQIITRTREEALNLWITALESGKYKQAKCALRETKRTGKDRRLVHSFCCIGVACDLARKDGGPVWTSCGEADPIGDEFMTSSTDFPEDMRKFLGITIHEEAELIEMNDERNKGFKEIAKYIREVILPAALERP